MNCRNSSSKEKRSWNERGEEGRPMGRAQSLNTWKIS